MPDPNQIAAYDQIAAFFDPRIQGSVDSIADGLRLGLGAEDCFISATRAVRKFSNDPDILAAAAGLIMVRMAEERVSHD